MFVSLVVNVYCTCVPDGVQDFTWHGKPGSVAVVIQKITSFCAQDIQQLTPCNSTLLQESEGTASTKSADQG